jgi:hypothetical protein
MMKIRITAVALAFVAELGLDQIFAAILVHAFGHTGYSPDMSDAERAAFVQAVWSDGGFVFCAFALGTATTILGGYACARIAKVFPYYNGLAIGIVGVLFIALTAGEGPVWYTVLGLLLAVPASIYGAHLAKPHIAAAS